MNTFDKLVRFGHTPTHYQCMAPMHVSTPGVLLGYDDSVEFCKQLKIGGVEVIRMPTLDDLKLARPRAISISRHKLMSWSWVMDGQLQDRSLGDVALIRTLTKYKVPKHHQYQILPVLEIPINT